MDIARTKTVLVSLAFLLLSLPLLQKKMDLFPESPLDGVSERAAEPGWSWKAWFEGDYQKQAEAHFNENFGGRNGLVRLNNQLKWSWKEEGVPSVVVGKEQTLFRSVGVKCFLGIWYDGEAKCRQLASEIKVFQDYLEVYGTKLCYIVAPGKQSYYKELLPDELQPLIGQPNSKDGMVKFMEETGVNLVDMDAWFCQMKDTVSHPLFPQVGAHWGRYGQFLAADSLTHLIENMTGVDLPELECEKLYLGRGDVAEDYDVGLTLNLFRTIPTYPMAFPKVRIRRNAKQLPVNVLLIGDSFFQEIYKAKYMEKVLGGGEFWHLAETIEPARPGFPMVKDLDLWDALTAFDLVLVTATGANTGNFGWDIHKKADLSRRNLIEVKPEKYIQLIRNDPRWLQSTKEKARKQGIPLAKMLQTEAEFMVEQNYREQLK